MFDLNDFDFTKTTDRRALSDLLLIIIDKLDALPSSPAPRHNPGAVFGHVPSDWPVIGGPNFRAVESARFERADFRRLFIPGRLARVYATGCTGLRTLATLLDLPLRKVGVTEAEDVRIRLGELSRDRYAALVRTANGFETEPGFDNFVAAQIHCATAPSRFSPVKLEPRALAVRLPAGFSVADFEKELQLALDDASLANWIKTPEGQRHFAQLGLDQRFAERFTDYRYGGASVPLLAKELLVFRPRCEGDRLVSVIERVVLKRLGLNE